MKKSSLPPGSKVWIVARHSPGQNQAIYSQLSLLNEYCQHNQLNPVDTFIDAGESGSNSNREEFTRMRKLAEGSEANLVDGIIFYDNSRFARNFQDAQYVKSMLRWKGYALEWLLGERFEGLPGILMENIEDYQNAEYLEMISRKSKDGLRQMFKLKDGNGEYLRFWAGGIPWGFRGVEKVLPVINTVTNKPRIKQCIEPDYPLWPLGQELFTLRATGLTCKEIEQRTGFFGQRGTVNVNNAFVLASSYKNFFRNPIYKGVLVFQELTLENYAPAMVSPELWEAANSASITYKRGHWTARGQTKVSKANPEYLLAGLCECEICQAPFYSHSVLSGSKDRWLRYYVCRTKKTIGGKACPTRYLPAAGYEPAVIGHAKNNYFQFIEFIIEEMNELQNNAPRPALEIERIRDELTTLDRSIRNLVKLAEKGEEVEEVYQRITELNRQRQAALNRVEQLHFQATSFRDPPSPEKIRREVSNLQGQLVDDPRIALKQIVDRITVNAIKSTIYYKMPLGVIDTFPPEAFYSYQIGYTIELPC